MRSGVDPKGMAALSAGHLTTDIAQGSLPALLPFLALRSAAMPEDGGFNSGYYSNPEVDQLLEQARRETDQAKRAELYKEMQAIVYEEAPWAFIASWKQNAVTTADVHGFSLEPSFFLVLRGVSKG